MARDILATMGNAFGFIASKEVVVAPWFKKPDVELLDPSGREIDDPYGGSMDDYRTARDHIIEALEARLG